MRSPLERHPDAIASGSRAVWIAALWAGLTMGAGTAVLFEHPAPSVTPPASAASEAGSLAAAHPEATMTGVTPDDPTGGEPQPPTF